MLPAYHTIRIILITGIECSFKGLYRRDLETRNWHYYETIDGNILHFRKSTMAAVLEGTSAQLRNVNK